MEKLAYSDIFDSVRLSNLIRRASTKGAPDVPLARLFCHLAAGEIMKNLVFGKTLVLPENAIVDSGHFFALACTGPEAQSALIRSFAEGKIRISCTAESLKARLARILMDASPDERSGEFVLSGWPELQLGTDVKHFAQALVDPQAIGGLPSSLVEKLEFIHRLDDALAKTNSPFAKRYGAQVRMNELLKAFALSLRAFDPVCAQIIECTRQASEDNSGVVNRSLCYRFLSDLKAAIHGQPTSPPTLLGESELRRWADSIRQASSPPHDRALLSISIEDARDVIDFAYNHVVSSDHRASNRTLSGNDLSRLATDAIQKQKRLGIAGVQAIAPRSVSKYFVGNEAGLDWASFFKILDSTTGQGPISRATQFAAEAGDQAVIQMIDRSPALSIAVGLGGAAYRVVDAYHRSETDQSPVLEEVIGLVLEKLGLDPESSTDAKTVITKAFYAFPEMKKNADIGQTSQMSFLRSLAAPMEQSILQDLLWNMSGD